MREAFAVPECCLLRACAWQEGS